MAPRETENNAYAKFWGDKQRTLWYVMVFLEWSMTEIGRCVLGHVIRLEYFTERQRLKETRQFLSYIWCMVHGV